MLIKNKVFWIITPLFLIASLAIIWLMYPPLIEQLRANRTDSAALDKTLLEQKQYVELVTSLTSEEQQVLSLYQSAQTALPVTTNSEMVLLQLDGLLNSIDLSSATITAPFSVVVPVAAKTSTSSSDVKPSTQSGSNPTTTPVVKSNNQTIATVTITAETNFTTLKSLLEKLRQLARWNKIVSIDVSVAADKMTVVVTTQIFTKPDATKEFAGTDPQFLTKATQLFSGFTSYATKPDATKEGNYGRKDPYAPL